MTMTDTAPNPRAMTIAGWVLTGLFTAFMIFDVGIKLAQLPIVAETMRQMKFPPHLGLTIGVLEGIFLVLYIVPRTQVLGAILLSGVMGGAFATHLRMESPLFSHLLFGTYLGVMMWGGLWLRDPKLRTMIPLRT